MSIFVLGQDTVMIEDDGNARFAIFENGSVAQTISTAGHRDLVRGLRSYGTAPGGYVLMGTSSHRSGFPDPWLPGYLVRVALDGLGVDTIATYDRVPFESREGPRFPFMPFGEVTAVDGRFVTARSDLAEIRWLGADGALAQIIRWTPELEYPSAAHLEEFRAYVRAELRRVNPQLGGTELERFVSEQASQYELTPDRPFPLFGSIQADDEGRIWLEPYSAWGIRVGFPGFTLFGPDGEWVGRVESPHSFQLLDVAEGRVLGVETDELDVEHVVVYALSAR